MPEHTPEPGIPSPVLQYQTTTGFGSAPTLVLLHGIFTLVVAGLNLIGFVIFGSVIGFVVYMLTTNHNPFTGSVPRPMPKDEMTIILSIYGGMALMSLCAGIVQCYAGLRLVRKKPRSWGWGLAAAIVSMVHLWCSYACFIPLSFGIFGLVVMCLENSQRYMKSWNDNGKATAGTGIPV